METSPAFSLCCVQEVPEKAEEDEFVRYFAAAVSPPQGPRIQHFLKTLSPKAIRGMVFGTRDLEYLAYLLGLSGLWVRYDP